MKAAYIRYPFCMAFVVAFILSVFLVFQTQWLILGGYQAYPDFVAGLITFNDYNKDAEGRLFLVGLCLFFALYPLTSFALKQLAKRWHQPLSQKTNEHLSYQNGYRLLAGTLLGEGIVRGTLPWPQIAMALTLGGMSFLSIGALHRAIKDIGTSWIVLFISWIGLATLNAMILKGSIIPDFSAEVVLWAITALAVGIGLLRLKKQRSADLTLCFLQLPSLFIPLRFSFYEIVGSNGPLVIQCSFRGQIIFWGFVLSLFIWSSWKILTLEKWNKDFLPVLPATLLMAGFLFSLSFPPANPLAADDFHLGEMLLPWYQLFHHHRAMYFQFVPVQGLIAIANGGANWLLYDGTVATYSAAAGFIASTICGVTVLITGRILGPLGALLLAPILFPFLDRFYLVAPCFLILASPELLSRPRWWLGTAVAVCAVAFYWNAPTALSLGAATAPVGIIFLWQAATAKKPATELLRLLLPSFFAALVVGLVIPIYGIATFVYENGYINTVQHASKLFETWDANGWFPKYFESSRANRIAWEIFRIGGWIFVCTLLYTSLINRWKRWKDPNDRGMLILTLGGVIFSILLFPYSMGRVDPPEYLSRVGTVSMVMLSFFLPASLLYSVRYCNQKIFSPFIAGLLVGIPFSIRNPTFTAYLQVPTQRIWASAELTLQDGKAVGLPILGKGYFWSERIKNILSLKSALDHVAPNPEDLVDLTNYSANSVFLERPFNMLYPSANAVGQRIQKRILQQFEAHPPKAVWVYPMFELDRAAEPIRNAYLFRWLMDHHYHLIVVGSYRFLVSEDRFQNLGIPEASDKEWRETFFRPNLDGVARAWGKSWRSLSPLVTEKNIDKRFQNPQGMLLDEKNSSLTLTAKQGTIDLLLPSNENGLTSHYLKIDFQRQGRSKRKRNFKIGLLQQRGSDIEETSTFSLWTTPPTVIIPLYSTPDWYRHETIGLRLTFEEETIGGVWKIENVSLLKSKF